MKFSTIIFSIGLVAAASAKTVSEASAASSKVQKCLEDECPAGDTACQAKKCLGIPAPNYAQVNANTKCATEICTQGDGSAKDTKKYGDCLRECAVQLYLPNGKEGAQYEDIPNPVAAGTESDTNSTTTTTSDTPDDSSSDAKSGTKVTTTKTRVVSSGSNNSTATTDSDSDDSDDKSSGSKTTTTSESTTTETAEPTSDAGKLVASGAALAAVVVGFFFIL